MNRRTQQVMVVCLVLLTLTYLWLLTLAMDGFGFSGYRGYATRGLFRGSVETYHDRSARNGSAGGLGVVGGGPEGGK